MLEEETNEVSVAVVRGEHELGLLLVVWGRKWKDERMKCGGGELIKWNNRSREELWFGS